MIWTNSYLGLSRDASKCCGSRPCKQSIGNILNRWSKSHPVESYSQQSRNSCLQRVRSILNYLTGATLSCSPTKLTAANMTSSTDSQSTCATLYQMRRLSVSREHP